MPKRKPPNPIPPMAPAPVGMTLEEMGQAFENAVILLERLEAAGVLAPQQPARKPQRPRKPKSGRGAG
jgi:hypothetical protein